MNELEIWVVYQNPTDVPNKFVARKWINDKFTKTMHIADTLEEIRSKIPQGLYKLNRFAYDDPKVVETWL